MNRRTFFRNLVLGAIAAPAVVKVLSEEKPRDVAAREVEIMHGYKCDALGIKTALEGCEDSLTRARICYMTPEFLAALDAIERNNPGAISRVAQQFDRK